LRLIDCFTELMVYASYAIGRAEKGEIGYDRLRKDVDRLIQLADTRKRTAGFSDEDFDLARFAVCAWVDETVLCSSWEGRHTWEHEQLQRVLYGTTSAGEGFFERLNSIDPENKPLLEVYSICLELGFAGRYYSVLSRPDLEETIANTLALATEDVEDPFLSEERTFFPTGYLDPNERPRKRLQVGSLPLFMAATSVLAAGALVTVWLVMNNILQEMVDKYFSNVL